MKNHLIQFKTFIIANKITAGLVGFLILIVLSGGMLFMHLSSKQNSAPANEVELPFDAVGAYAILSPRKDGNALVLDLKRTSSYDSISYEIAYTSLPDSGIAVGGGDDGDGSGSPSAGATIERGVVGNIDTKDKKGEYEQEILFGTCSKNVCQYDQGVENGTLTLHIRKGDQAYRMDTQWHLQQPSKVLGILTSGDDHFTYKMNTVNDDLIVPYTIVNDLTGVPKLPDGLEVTGKVYAVNAPSGNPLPSGTVSIEIAQNPPSGSKLARYDDAQNKWIEYNAPIQNGKVTSTVEGSGIFAILSPTK